MDTSREPDELLLPVLRVVTGVADDERRPVSVDDVGYLQAMHAFKWQDGWSDAEHRDWWLSQLLLEWPTGTKRVGYLWPKEGRGGHRQSLASAVSFGVRSGLPVDEALDAVGVQRSAGNYQALRGLALDYAEHRATSTPDMWTRFPRVVLDDLYSGLEWLNGWCNVADVHGQARVFRMEDLALDTFLRARAAITERLLQPRTMPSAPPRS